MANLITRTVARLMAKAAKEGEYRDGPWYLPITGGILPADVGSSWNWWQMGYDPVGACPNAMVEACISAYARTVAMSPGDHWLLGDDGGRERITTTAASRMVRRPNDYQTISDFLFNAVRQLFLNGNAYALALRNDRFEVNELHLMHSRSSGVRITPTGDVFYSLGGNDVVEARLGANAQATLAAIPARNVLHIRLATPRHPLIGESPLLAALPDLAASGAMTRQQINFYLNQARPSFILSTDAVLTIEQTEQIRQKWEEKTTGVNAGRTPILSNGLKPQMIGGDAKDAQFVQALDAADRHVALALGVPLQVLGAGKSAPFASTETMMQAWLAGGLGFILNHLELAFDRLFGLSGFPTEYVAFDTAMLLRSNARDRMETHAVALRAGVMTNNEVRREEQLPDVQFGDEIRVQQQDVPLSFWHQQAEQKTKPPPPQQQQPPPPAPPASGDGNAARSSAEWARYLLDAADEWDRRAA